MRVLSSTHDSVRVRRCRLRGQKLSCKRGDVDLIRSAVASETKSRGGDAAIQMNDNTSFAGIVRMIPQMYMATDVKTMRFAVVKYVQ
jgi:hypothetical protein